MRVGSSAKKVRSVRGLIVGIIIGVVIGSSGLVYSAMGRPGWDKQPAAFKLGYLAGFTDVVRIAKGSTPTGLIATTYSIPQNAKLVNWLYHVEKVFAEEKNAGRNITQIIALAGPSMAKEYGGDVTVATGMERLAEALKQRREAINRGEVEQIAPEVIARRDAIRARNKAFAKCMAGAHREAKTTCKAKIKKEFAPVPELRAVDPAAEKDE